VQTLAAPGYLIEVDAIAVVDQGGGRPVKESPVKELPPDSGR
jgi:hypothetical protein